MIIRYVRKNMNNEPVATLMAVHNKIDGKVYITWSKCHKNDIFYKVTGRECCKNRLVKFLDDQQYPIVCNTIKKHLRQFIDDVQYKCCVAAKDIIVIARL